jgi:hypothetical protein
MPKAGKSRKVYEQKSENKKQHIMKMSLEVDGRVLSPYSQTLPSIQPND